MTELSWPEVTLEDVATDVTVGFVGTMAHEYVANGVPFLRSLNVEPFRINANDLKFINPTFHKQIRKSALAPGDVVIVRTGKPGACAVVPEWLPDANCSDLVVVRPGPTVLPRYLCYVINSVASHHVEAFTVGAVQQHFNVGAARKIRFRRPSLREQDKIVALLGALDDKIELNRRMNETLEAMARAIFQDWFVAFGPTRAKMEGRPPYLAPDFWSLFPDGLDAEGKPEGWAMSSVGQEFRLTMGQSPPGETYNAAGNGLPFFQGRTDFGFRYPKQRIFCTAPTRHAEADDTLISVRAPVGDLNLARETCCIGRGVAAARHRLGSRSYTYYALWAIQPDLTAFEHTGTVFGAINKAQFELLKVIAPDDRLVAAFASVVSPMDDRIRHNEDETLSLIATRDLLLPRLMSGELRVKDAEHMVAEVA